MNTTPNVTLTMPAGSYYVGDLCYVMNPQWEEFCEKTIVGHACIDGEVILENGIKIVQFRTAYGDGRYSDQLGNEYGVDAGLIGCIRTEDINDPDSYIKGGNIINFNSDFKCSSKDGVLKFGHIVINTDEDDEEYDE